MARDRVTRQLRWRTVLSRSCLTSATRFPPRSMNGPPRSAGFFTADSCVSGESIYESIIRRCRSVRFLAAVAGGIRWAHAYQPSTSGSTITLDFKYLAPLFISVRRKPLPSLQPDLASTQVAYDNDRANSSHNRMRATDRPLGPVRKKFKENHLKKKNHAPQ